MIEGENGRITSTALGKRCRRISHLFMGEGGRISYLAAGRICGLV